MLGVDTLTGEVPSNINIERPLDLVVPNHITVLSVETMLSPLPHPISLV